MCRKEWSSFYDLKSLNNEAIYDKKRIYKLALPFCNYKDSEWRMKQVKSEGMIKFCNLWNFTIARYANK